MRFHFWEAVAVSLSLMYTFLIGGGAIYAWPFAISAGLIYTVLCINRRIYAESFLHFFYVIMGVYGWLTWGANTLNGYQTTLPLSTHFIAIPVLLVLTYLSGQMLGRFTDAKVQYVDSFTTVFSIWATFLMVNVYLENWWYFIFINGVGVYLYFHRKMYLTSILMITYVFLSIKGYGEWRSM